MQTFSRWSGSDGIEEFIIKETGCKPYSGAGINPRIKQKTCILRSVDCTYYYDDNLNDVNRVTYTLFGHNGHQDEHEKKFNAPLLTQTDHIYLYRVRYVNSKKQWVWYGKYKIAEKQKKEHIGKDMILRNIIVLTLIKTV